MIIFQLRYYACANPHIHRPLIKASVLTLKSLPKEVVGEVKALNYRTWLPCFVDKGALQRLYRAIGRSIPYHLSQLYGLQLFSFLVWILKPWGLFISWENICMYVLIQSICSF